VSKIQNRVGKSAENYSDVGLGIYTKVNGYYLIQTILAALTSTQSHAE